MRDGAPGETRTPDPLLRRQMLYPAELRARRANKGILLPFRPRFECHQSLPNENSGASKVSRGALPNRKCTAGALQVHNARVEAVVFIGVQGSGKSTFYGERFFGTHVRINLDMLRTRRREQILLAACIEAGQSFVIDNTNALKGDRARYIPLARAAGFRVAAYFFQTTLADAMRRNNQRPGKQKIPALWPQLFADCSRRDGKRALTRFIQSRCRVKISSKWRAAFAKHGPAHQSNTYKITERILGYFAHSLPAERAIFSIRITCVEI